MERGHTEQYLDRGVTLCSAGAGRMARYYLCGLYVSGPS